MATLVAKLSIGDNDVPVLGFVALAIVTVLAIFGWTRRLDRQAREAGARRHAVFSCTTTLQIQLMRNVPKFEEALRRVRMTWLIGGWLSGKLFVSEVGFVWAPNAWTSRIFRVPDLEAAWDEVEGVATTRQRGGPFDAGLFEVKFTDGSEVAFMIIRRTQMAVALQDLGLA